SQKVVNAISRLQLMGNVYLLRLARALRKLDAQCVSTQKAKSPEPEPSNFGSSCYGIASAPSRKERPVNSWSARHTKDADSCKCLFRKATYSRTLLSPITGS